MLFRIICSLTLILLFVIYGNDIYRTTTNARPVTRIPNREGQVVLGTKAASRVTQSASGACADAWTMVANKTIASIPFSNNGLNDVAALSASQMWAVGYRPGNNLDQPLVQRWDGTRWNIEATPIIGSLGSGLNSRLNGVTDLSPSNVWAVGEVRSTDAAQTLIMHWDGSSWSRIVSPNLSSGYNVLYNVAAISANDIWAVGSNGVRSIAIHWNGTAWTIIPTPTVGAYADYLVDVNAIASNNVWAVGRYLSSGLAQTLILHWNGTSWNQVSSPNGVRGTGQLKAIAAASSTDIWAVGDDSIDSLTLHWNGTSWSRVPSPNSGGGANYLTGVATITSNDVWAVGYDPYKPLSLHWDGVSWRSIPMQGDTSTGNYIQSVAALSATDVWAVGGNTKTLIERYAPTISFSDKSFWSQEASGASIVTVAMKSPAVQPVTVDYATSDGTATNGSDYNATSGTLSLAPCATSVTFAVPLLDDASWEGAKTFGVMLRNPTSAQLLNPSTATDTISDPEDASVSINLPLAFRSSERTGRIAFVSERDGNKEIYIMNADGSEQQRLTNEAAADFDPAWSPDGQRIAFVSERAGNREIYIINSDGTGLMRLTNTSSEEVAPSWSPDGRRIAFVSDRARPAGSYGSYRNIYAMNSDGSQAMRITAFGAQPASQADGNPSWSPDGLRIVFESNRDSTNGSYPEIYIVNADGSQLRRLTSNNVDDVGPSWSPDGQLIVYASGLYPLMDLYTIKPDGTQLRQVNTNFDTGSMPTWSVDGQRIAYSTTDDIYITKMDGSQPQNISASPGYDYDPAWSPK